ncbi:MAG TPA: hypothetical protein VF449_03135, partial [Parvibaculum sp.]
MADRKSLIEAPPPRRSRIGDWSLAFAAAFALHAAILVPFLMHFEDRNPVAPGASAVMVNIVRADSGPAETKAAPEKPKAEAPPQKPVEKPRPPRLKPAIAEAPKTAPVLREH